MLKLLYVAINHKTILHRTIVYTLQNFRPYKKLNDTYTTCTIYHVTTPLLKHCFSDHIAGRSSSPEINRCAGSGKKGKK